MSTVNGTLDAALIARAREVDLLALLERDGVRLTRVAATQGGEWAGPCPWCGGEDRFRVQPQQGRWWCRHCSPDARWHDPIAYAEKRDRMGFREAVERLTGGAVATTPRPVTQPRPPAPSPSPIWQERAARFASPCVAQLWSPEGERALDYLRGRGLTDDTLLAWGIGFHAEATTEPATSWGLTGPAMRLPRGITLPWRDAEGRVQGVKVRLNTPANAPKSVRRYDSVPGSRFPVYGVGQLGRGGLDGQPDLPPGRRVLLLAEGEVDCLTGWQEAGDVMDVVTLGGASAGGGGAAPALLVRYRHVLVAYDVDANRAGQQGAARLVARSARARRLELPAWVVEAGGKDINDVHRLGGPGGLREWLTDTFLELIPPGEGLPEVCALCSEPIHSFTTEGEARCAAHGPAEEVAR